MNHSLTFFSKSLDRKIDFISFASLTLAELRMLNGELIVCDLSIADSIAKAECEASDGTQPMDKDWLHGIRKKHRICKAFLAQSTQLLGAIALDTNVYTTYSKVFHQLLTEELGAAVLGEIMEAAKVKASTQLGCSMDPCQGVDA